MWVGNDTTGNDPDPNATYVTQANEPRPPRHNRKKRRTLEALARRIK